VNGAGRKSSGRFAREHLPVPPLSAVPNLIEYLSHSSADARIAAAEQLLRLGSDAGQAAGALRQRLQDPDRRVALAMATALGAVDSAGREFLVVLVESLHANDHELRDRALYYCERLGPRAAGVMGELVSLFDDDPDDERYDFEKEWNGGMSSLSLPPRIGPAALPLLRKMLSRGKPRVRMLAAWQLIELGPRVCRQGRPPNCCHFLAIGDWARPRRRPWTSWWPN